MNAFTDTQQQQRHQTEVYVCNKQSPCDLLYLLASLAMKAGLLARASQASAVEAAAAAKQVQHSTDHVDTDIDIDISMREEDDSPSLCAPSLGDVDTAGFPLRRNSKLASYRTRQVVTRCFSAAATLHARRCLSVLSTRSKHHRPEPCAGPLIRMGMKHCCI